MKIAEINQESIYVRSSWQDHGRKIEWQPSIALTDTLFKIEIKLNVSHSNKAEQCRESTG